MKYEVILFDYAGTLAYEKKSPRFTIPQELQEMIRTLHGAGYRLGVVSNNHRHGDRLWLCNHLQGLSLLSYFECVVGSGTWGIQKPNPLIFLRPLHFMGVLPSRTLMVGNSETCDIKGAQDAGLDALLVDLDAEGIWVQKLMQALDDPHLFTRKANLITDYVQISYRKIQCLIRHLNEPVKPGDFILVGGCERQVAKVSVELTKDQVLSLGPDSISADLIQIDLVH